MARYIKANPKVTQFLRLENDRNQVKDGNYLLWQNDMLAFGRLTELPQILEQIGGIALQAHEARQEQDGVVTRELPTATDPRFVIESYETTEDTGEVEGEANETETVEPETTEDTGEANETETEAEPETTEGETSNEVETNNETEA